MDHLTWIPAIRHYEQERQEAAVPREAAEADHPLVPRRMREEPMVRLVMTSPIKGGSTTLSRHEQLASPGARGDPLRLDKAETEELDPLSAMMLQPSPAAAFLDPLANPPPSPSTPVRSGSFSSSSRTGGSTRGGGMRQEGQDEEEEEEEEELNPSWSSRKQAILSDFAISGTVRVRARLLTRQSSSSLADSGRGGEAGDEEGIGSRTAKRPAAQQSGGGDRYQQRLGQLESGLDDGGSQGGNSTTREMTQKEYLAHVERLHADLRKAWMNEERVTSLKLSIQCAKMLGDTSMPRYYPSMYVHVTEVLDSFGAMVFDRLKAKAVEHLQQQPPAFGRGGSSSRGGGSHHHHLPPPCLPRDFRAADVSDSAKETCRNWFFKTACIRELLPRFYIECAFIRCYRFLADDEAPAVLTRLAGIVRGIGDPLVAAYARAYMARQAVFLRVSDAHVRLLVLALVADQLAHLQDFRSHAYYASSYLAGRAAAGGKITDEEYVNLQSPALDWLFRVLARQQPPSKEVFTTVLGHYRDLSNSPIVLRLVMECFDPSLYSVNCNAMVALVKMIPDISLKQTLRVLGALGSRLHMCPPPEEQRLPLLNEVWRLVTKAGPEELDDYCATVAAWVGLAAKAYSAREVLIMLNDLGKHIDQAAGGGEEAAAAVALTSSVALSEAGQEALECVVRTVVTMGTASTATTTSGGASSSSLLLTSEHLMKMMDLMSRPGRKHDMCKDLLEAFAKRAQATADPVLIHALLEIARTLHDSLDSLSAEGDRRHVSQLICGFITLMDMGGDVEQALALYVDCRAAFPNLDLVLDCLVLCVAKLAIRITTQQQQQRRQHTKKSSAFVRACLAYCHITIPSLTDVLRRLSLTLLCGQVALLNHCLPQTDTFIKSAISLIPDVPSHEEVDYRRTPTEARLTGLLLELTSTLVLVPGHPEYGPFYLVQGLLNAMARFPGWQPRSGLHLHVQIQVLGLLGCYAQRRLPYSLPGVESNDVLYGGAPQYMAELQTKFHDLLTSILAQMAALGGGDPHATTTNEQQPSTPPTAGGLRRANSSSGGGGGVAMTRQAELALELLNQLAVVCRLEGKGMQALVDRLVALASPLKAQSYHRSTMATMVKALDHATTTPSSRRRTGGGAFALRSDGGGANGQEEEELAARLQQALKVH